MSSKQKLELTWIGKEKQTRLESRILVEVPEKSYHSKEKKGENDQFENMLIHGDNLLSLKALEQDFTEKIKCIYIDPPFNTKKAFTHYYDDCLEHSIWLNLMRPRLEILRNLLSEDGSIWISIDDDEGHYLKVLCDEIFGRNNFVATCIWHKKHTRQNDARWFSDNHDFILVYALSKLNWKPNLLPRTDESAQNYSNPDNDPRGVWQSLPLQAKSGTDTNFEHTFSNGVVWRPPAGRFSAFSHESLQKMEEDNRIWFGKNGNNVPRYKKFLSEVKDGFVPTTLWFREEVGDNQDAKNEMKALNADDPFPTPKPERLIERIISLATNPGDLVLDSFLGSGTTAAVAHKMGRRWIGIELGDHCYTHCIPRLQKVIDGIDQGGITQAVDWQGGGGFRFFELGESAIKVDDWGQEVINEKFNAEMLAEAVCKIEGFTYAPSQEEFFIHGYSSEQSFIYVTANYVKAEMLHSLSEQLGPKRLLTVYCMGFDEVADLDNIIVKKIPESILKKFEIGRGNYDLNVCEAAADGDDDE